MPKTRDEYSEVLESQYKRLERKYTEVKNNLDPKVFTKSSQQILDSADEFFVLSYHLREWVRKDNKVDKSIKDKIPSFENPTLKPTDPKIALQICRDLCNSFKHKELNKDLKPNDINTKINLIGPTKYEVPFSELADSKNQIHLKEEDGIFMGRFMVFFKGNQYDLLGVVEGCMHFWRSFFENNDLILPRSTP